MKTADPGIDARDQSLPCDGRDPPVRPGLAGRDLATDRTERHHRLRHHRGAARRPPHHPVAGRRGARRRARPAARHAQAQSGRGACGGRQARARPDHRRGDQFLRRHPAHRSRCRSASIARPPRSSPIWSRTACAAASATQVSRSRKSPASASACRASSSGPAGVCRQSPILQERDVPFGADLTQRLGVPGFDRQRRQSRDAGRALVRTGARLERLSRRQRRAQPRASAFFTTANCFAAPTASAPTSAISWFARPAAAAGGSPTSPRRRRCSTEAEALLRDGEPRRRFAAGRGMALLLQRAAGGDKRCVARARRRGRGAGLRRRQPHHPVRAAEGHHFRPRHGDQRTFHRAAAQDGRRASAAEPRRRRPTSSSANGATETGCRAPRR